MINDPRFRYARPRPAAPRVEGASLRQKLQALLHSDPLINGVVAAAVVVGFLHGWLKVQIASPAVTFLFDGTLCVALTLAYFQLARGASFIPPGPIGDALKIFYGLCFLYLLLPIPDRPPIIISVAAIRGWCFATLMFTLGYRLTKTIAQVKGYFYVLIILGLGTSLYGIQQRPEAILERMKTDEAYAERHKNTFYVSEKGAELRVFSTFVSSGAFGGTMAYVAVLCVVLISDPRTGRRERLVLLGVLVPVVSGMSLSASRTALVSLLAGFSVVAWQRRNFQNFVVIPVCLFVVLSAGIHLTGGGLAGRYGSLLSFDNVYGRHSTTISVAWDFMRDNLLGGGLGRGAYSVPSFLADRYPEYKAYVFCDGDLGRLMIEMGLLGLAGFGHLVWVIMKTIFERLRELRETAVGDVALASAACVVMAIISFPSGSPFLGIPMGAMVWFFLGTFIKLSDDQRMGGLGPAEPRPAPGNPPPGKRYRYWRGPSPATPPPEPA